MAEIERKWYVIKTVTGTEKNVKQNIESEIEASHIKDFVDSSGSYVYINRVTPRRRMKWINVAKTIFMCNSPTTPGADGYVLDPNNALIDGLRNVEDIALPDSMGHTFLALTDGSYVFER